MGERATKAQMIQRVDKVFQWQLDGRDSDEICQLAIESWGIAEDTARTYIQKARNRLKSLTNASKEDNLSYTLGNLTGIVTEAREKELYQPALQALSQFAKITGLEKLVIEMPNDELPEISEDEVLAQLESESAVH